MLDRMVEHCAELVMEGLQVNGRIGFSILIPVTKHLILPGEHIFGLDLTHFLRPK